MISFFRIFLIGLILTITSVLALAQENLPKVLPSPPAANSQEAREAELEAAAQAAGTVKIAGPAKVILADQGVLDLPAGMNFIGKLEATRLMRAMGNVVSDKLIGMVFGDGTPFWIVPVTFIKEGYVKDDEARDWKPDALLQSLREGTEQANKDRMARGFDPIEITGWIEPPAYDSSLHRLVWSAAIRNINAAPSASGSMNYNTYMLGREGYFSLNLIGAQDESDKLKPKAKVLLAGVSFNPGKKYENFNASTDTVAAYGIAALIGGLAAKKLGLFALAAAFLLKFAKLGAIAVLGLFVAIKKLFVRKKPPAELPEKQEMRES